MKGKDFRYLLDTIDNEGFEYAMIHYSEIEDEEFHRLRNKYLEATKELVSYLGHDGLL